MQEHEPTVSSLTGLITHFCRVQPQGSRPLSPVFPSNITDFTQSTPNFSRCRIGKKKKKVAHTSTVSLPFTQWQQLCNRQRREYKQLYRTLTKTGTTLPTEAHWEWSLFNLLMELLLLVKPWVGEGFLERPRPPLTNPTPHSSLFPVLCQTTAHQIPSCTLQMPAQAHGRYRV